MVCRSLRTATDHKLLTLSRSGRRPGIGFTPSYPRSDVTTANDNSELHRSDSNARLDFTWYKSLGMILNHVRIVDVKAVDAIDRIRRLGPRGPSSLHEIHTSHGRHHLAE